MPYFDYNATTPPHPAALREWQETAEQAWHNPSSPYRAAARAHALLEEAREKLAALLRGVPGDFVFTSGATEANNMVFAHFARVAPANAQAIVSAIEHPSVLEAARFWFPGRLNLLPCAANGVVDLASLDQLLRDNRTAVVSLMAANNETGVLQPWAEAAKICRAHGVAFHCDATQWLGKLPPAHLTDCDFLTGSAHKFGGVRGAGFLKLPLHIGEFHGQLGGDQEHAHRAGTENVPAIRAMVAALAALLPELADKAPGWAKARERFEATLRIVLPEIKIIGEHAPRLWNTVMFLAPRHENTRWVAALDKLGGMVSTGSACATGSDSPSHVLAAMGVPAEAGRRAIRISAGWDTSSAEWGGLLPLFATARDRLDAAP